MLAPSGKMHKVLIAVVSRVEAAHISTQWAGYRSVICNVFRAALLVNNNHSMSLDSFVRGSRTAGKKRRDLLSVQWPGIWMFHISVHVFIKSWKSADVGVPVVLFPKGLHYLLMLQDILSMATYL